MAGSKLDRLGSKLDAVADNIGQINVTLGKQQVSLDEHVRRTNLLEDRVDDLHASRQEFKGAVKFLKILAVLAAIGESIRVIFKP